MTKMKKLLIGFGIAVFLLFAAGMLFSFSVRRYMDRNTWATVSVTGEIHSDTDEAFAEEHEYLKGGSILFEDVILRVEKITHAGTVTFSVKQGTLCSEAGETVTTGVIERDVQSHYRLNNGSVTLTVTNNRYR